MIDSVVYDFTISTTCFILNLLAIFFLGFALRKKRDICTLMFALAVFISIATSFCNMLIGALRFTGLNVKYKAIVSFNYNVVTIAEPFALLALYSGFIIYGLAVIRTNAKQKTVPQQRQER